MIESSPAYKQAIGGDARRVFAQNDKEPPSGVACGVLSYFLYMVFTRTNTG